MEKERERGEEKKRLYRRRGALRWGVAGKMLHGVGVYSGREGRRGRKKRAKKGSR